MNKYKHSENMKFTHLAAILFLPKGRPGQCYKTRKKSLTVLFFFPLEAHKHMAEPLETFLKLSFDMIEFSYAP